MCLWAGVRHAYGTVFPPIRDRLYRLMVQDGLFPASPGHVRAGWMFAGAVTAVAGFLLPSYGPSWLGFFDTWPRIRGGFCGPLLLRLGWGMPPPNRARAPPAA